MLVTSDRGGGEAPWVPLTTWWRSSKPYSFQRLGLVTTLTHNILYALFLLSKYCKLPHSSVPSYLMSFQSRLGRSFLNFTSFDRIKSAHIWSGTPASAQVDVPDLAPDPSVCPDQTDRRIRIDSCCVLVVSMVSMRGWFWSGYVCGTKFSEINLQIGISIVETLLWDLLVCYEPYEQFAGAVFKL